MTRAVRAVSLYRPVWEADGRRVAGPDEDPFTLAVAALEALGTVVETPTFGRLWTLGPIAPPSGPGFPEALGRPGVEVRPVEVSERVEETLSRALREASGPALFDAVVAVDPGTAGEEGAYALAWLLGEGPGLSLEPGSGAPAPQPPVAFTAAQRRGRTPADRADPKPPVDAPAEATKQSSAAGGGMALAERARAMGAGSDASVPDSADSSRWTLRVEAPIRWAGAWETRAAPVAIGSERARRLRDAIPLDRVSEGAYLPRPRYIESLPSRWRLLADRCGRCGTRTFPPRGVCRRCGARTDLHPEPLPRDDGEVEAITTVRAGAQPTEFDPQVERFGDYDVAIVRLAPDVRATFQVTDALPGTVRVGDRVRTSLRRLYAQEGEWRYGRKAMPKTSQEEARPPS